MLPKHIPHYFAPAKLNLDLRITGRRDDGYHLLESIFVLIDWGDTLAIQKREDEQIILHTPTQGVLPENDLTVRAAHLLQQHSSCLKGADIWIQKRIPMGGGLGGGSSDAATVLMVLNRLWQCGFSRQKMMDLGVQLGADVPFFLFGQSAFARGIGEQLQAIEVPDLWFNIVCPPVHIATARIFQHPSLTRNSQPAHEISYAALQPFRNDMQSVVLAEYPQINEIYVALSGLGVPLMTGSGACFFLSSDNPIIAQSLANRLPENWYHHQAVLLQQHPLFDYLN
ncbi:MAG: 4-(cytidine 5'-diphospho)-2-C-methyl-D-erythritol kinase [Alysiella sp.]|uniref:4-(cytidine 5'-diphospho)-2-C-methyl-D-erythritol kinase n=1 Tax=Alysiella sp. TaxID=1872483 RepID=UPI0026DB58E7|nr:4-(cytidine 5'-diphospho)-2-C-methyl-D-erythritol kinase [Alysiella sp.]MDO4434145.1 4-(cytidine 5'-diphospho)-2-C-methyl-D-erythritol kinase [Alysiella sp.]